ncbi:MAG: transcriptional regulator NrdR [Nitrospinae bacterium RIFCSPLOWO2_12_FULL_45_22]|nr:MAG: transcriptional regulator NrdR [Nitrospinae bacterium RIFCSPLOWO2_12_FULL_45_22]
MKCPYCRSLDSKVIDSRLSKEGNSIRRRRECIDCGQRYTTYEKVEDCLPVIIKKDGRRETFDRHKILIGINKALEKRTVGVEEREALLDRVEKFVQELGDREIPSKVIGEKVMQELHTLDEIAYVRFASVYRSFKDINDFMSELKDILNGRP